MGPLQFKAVLGGPRRGISKTKEKKKSEKGKKKYKKEGKRKESQSSPPLFLKLLYISDGHSFKAPSPT